MKTNRGFTLIELLVVIAIIGILSGVVLTSLGAARTKAKDKAIMADLVSLRTQMELVSSSPGIYRLGGYSSGYISTTGVPTDLQGVCNDAKSKEILLGVYSNVKKFNPPSVSVRCFIGQNGKTWMAIAKLSHHNRDGGGWYCVDSSDNNIDLPNGTQPAHFQSTDTLSVRCK
jgi:prepilin-type N-terminal cleavage/methylation domain-containing protein